MLTRLLNLAGRLATPPRAGWLAVLPLVALLVGGQFEVGAHHHDSGGKPDTCPVCLLAHAPAVEAASAPRLEAPALTELRPHVAPAQAPSAHSPRFVPSRAPPRA
jgi:hypothetical protein